MGLSLSLNVELIVNVGDVGEGGGEEPDREQVTEQESPVLTRVIYYIRRFFQLSLYPNLVVGLEPDVFEKLEVVVGAQNYIKVFILA